MCDDIKLRRIGAFTLDLLITFIITRFLSMFTLNNYLYLVNHLNVKPWYLWYFKYLYSFILFVLLMLIRDVVCKGTSLGKRLTKIKIVNYKTHNFPGYYRLIMRNLFVLFFPVDLILFLFKNRRLGDFVAKTDVMSNGRINNQGKRIAVYVLIVIIAILVSKAHIYTLPEYDNPAYFLLKREIFNNENIKDEIGNIKKFITESGSYNINGKEKAAKAKASFIVEGEDKALLITAEYEWVDNSWNLKGLIGKKIKYADKN